MLIIQNVNYDYQASKQGSFEIMLICICGSALGKFVNVIEVQKVYCFHGKHHCAFTNYTAFPQIHISKLANDQLLNPKCLIY